MDLYCQRVISRRSDVASLNRIGFLRRVVASNSLRFATFRYVSLRFATFRYVSLRFATFRYVSLRSEIAGKSLVKLFVGFQSAGSSNNSAGGINLGPVVGGRRPPSQQSFHSSKNNHSHHSRHQTTSAPPSTPRNACQLPEIATRCIRKYTYVYPLCLPMYRYVESEASKTGQTTRSNNSPILCEL